MWAVGRKRASHVWSLTDLKVFEYFILLAIGANCIVLALATPLPKDDRTDLSMKLVSGWKKASQIFLVSFPSAWSGVNLK